MIEKFEFTGADAAADIKQKYGFEGDLLDIFATNEGPIVHKWHHYMPLYDRYFSPFRGTDFRFLEIGVAKGGSLQMWRRYFGDAATITGIDIDPACAQFDGQAGNVRIGSQDDPEFLKSVVEEMGGVDVILDDGSHRMPHVRASLDTLFPMLSAPGLYMIEDLHTAYWGGWGGGLKEDGNFFRHLNTIIDDMHQWAHDGPPQDAPTQGWVTGIHVHDSIVVLEKEKNVQPTHSIIG